MGKEIRASAGLKVLPFERREKEREKAGSLAALGMTNPFRNC